MTLRAVVTSASSGGSGGLSTSLNYNYLYIGNSSNIATGVPVSGDIVVSGGTSMSVVSVGGKSVSLAGALTTMGSYGINFVATGSTNITLPTTGTLATVGSFLSTALNPANIYVGNGSSVATGVAVSGDIAISNAGAATVTAAGGKSIALSGALTTTGGYGITLVTTGATSVTMPTSGTLATTGTFLSTTLTPAYIYVGNGSSVATGVAVSGDIVMSNAGATTVTKVGGQSVTLAGSLTTSGAYGIAFVATAGTSVTLPTSGTISALSGVNTWTAAQIGSVSALTTSSGSIAVNLATANNYSIAMTANATLSNPTNMAAGQTGQIAITQNASTAYTLAYASYWIEATSGVAPSLSTTLSAQNILSYFVFDSTHVYFTLNKHGVA